MAKINHPLPDILFQALLALVTSAVLLFVLFMLGTDSGRAESAHLPPMAIPGKDLRAVVGSAEARGDQLAVTAYRPAEGAFAAVAVWRGRFEAADYPLLQYRIDSVMPEPELNLIWRTSSNPTVMHNTELTGTLNEDSWLDLARNPDWQGTVVELGVYAFADAANQPLTIDHLTLESAGWRNFLASVRSEWTSYRGWTSRSINYLYGTADPEALSPVVVAAAWSALALSLLVVAGLVFGRRQPGALVAVVLLPWIFLDLLWQKELMTQLSQTRLQFAGKNVQEKHLADIDADMFRYITRLKQEVLHTEYARIAILHNSRTHNFTRLKAQYYLLPHNAYNYGKMPPREGLEHIDFILVLGDIPGLEFHPQNSRLVWKRGKRSLAVEQLDKDPLGGLYRIQRSQSKADK